MAKTIKIGIDFGTSYCFCGAQFGDAVMPLIATTERYGVPSVFYYDRGQKLTGRQAERAAGRRPAYAVRSVKRKLGDDPFKLGEEGREFSPAEVVEEIIAGIVRDAETQLEQSYLEEYDELEAVITVPVDFSEPRKQLIMEAARRVRLKNGKNLRVTGVIPEPVAASIEYFGIKKERDANIIVFDLGGGTLDVALVRANAASAGIPYEVLDQEGNPKLGGDDWDEKLAAYLESLWLKEKGGKLTENDRRRLLLQARDIKVDLSSQERYIGDIELRGDYLPVEISRREFENMTARLLQSAGDTVRALAQRAKGRNIDHIILTGGSSNMPQIRAELERLRAAGTFSGTPDILIVEPEHAIAYGAARYAQTLIMPQEVITLRATHSYGIRYFDETKNRQMVKFLIKKGDVLPKSVTNPSWVRKPTKTSLYCVYESGYIWDDPCVYEKEHWGEPILEVRLTRKEAAPVGRETRDTLTLTKEGILTMVSVDQVTKEKIEGSIERKL